MARRPPDYILHESAVRVWLLAVAGLILITVLVGGATRLTESGLSIVEWRPVTGTLPPLSAEQWQVEFEKYKTIPQYQQVNRGMSLDEFKTIYWWEWTHRLLGRLIGAAFFLPLLWFWFKRWIDPALYPRLLFIFFLGAVQGGIGWWMVASGLVERVAVSQYRLAVHLTLACVIYAVIVWTLQRFRRAPELDAPAGVRVISVVLLVAVLAQIYLGALVAGLRAGLIYNTWPLIDGALIPSADNLFFEQPLWRNFFENTLMVQFNHRMMAYFVWALALWHAIRTTRAFPAGAPARRGAWLLFLALTLQAFLGILTLVSGNPLGLALAHQGVAMIVLTIAAAHAAWVCDSRRAPLGAATPHPVYGFPPPGA